jgi:hypothetical protein
MRKISTAITILLAGLFFFGSARAVETAVEGRVYATWWTYMNDTVGVYGGSDVDSKGWNQFNLERSYMTLKSKITDYTSVNITADLRPTSAFDGYDIILKYGYGKIMMPFYAPLSLTLGLSPTRYPEFIDGQVWERRYLEKNVGDRPGPSPLSDIIDAFLSTADLGATLDRTIGVDARYGSAGLSIWNGSGYTDITDDNKNKDFNIYAGLKPLANNPDFKRTAIGAQLYLGTQDMVIDTAMDAGDFKRQIISVGGKLNYRNYFDLGFDYWGNTLGQGPSPAEDLKQTAMMFFGAFYFQNLVSESSLFRTVNLLFRYDLYDPDMDSDPVEDNVNYMIIGVECAPAKGINASVNYRTVGFEDSDLDSQNYLYLNTEFRF